MEVDRAASAPGFFALAFGLVGMICGRFIGVADGRDFFWDLGMVEESVAEVRRHLQGYNVSIQYHWLKRSTV